MNLSKEVRRFKADLMEIAGGKEVACDSYPIKLFPCLFCECHTEWEFVQETPPAGTTDSFSYQCRKREQRLESPRDRKQHPPRKEMADRPSRGLVDNVRKNVQRLVRGPIGVVTTDPVTGKQFIAQTDDLGELDVVGGTNSIGLNVGIELEGDFESGFNEQEYGIDGESSVDAGVLTEVSVDENVWRLAVTAGAGADQSTEIQVGANLTNDDD